MARIRVVPALLAPSCLDKQPDVGLRKSRCQEIIKTLTMKDMLDQQQAVIRAVKIEHQSEGEGDLAKRKWKVVLLSTKDQLWQ